MKSLELRVASRENEKTIGDRMQPLFDPMAPFLLCLAYPCLGLFQLQNQNLQLLWLLPVEIGPRPAPCGVS
ncbi:unknown [Alistipes sp. CAG:268]|jgi:hypothetical protein|nr:unknown [Alistipes sp. CAG:268]